MKKLLLLSAIAIVFSGVSFAQPRQMHQQHPQQGEFQKHQKVTATPEEIAKRMTDRMRDQLELSDQQYKKIYDLNLKSAQLNVKIRESIQKERENLAKNIKERDSLTNILLDNSQKKLQKLYRQMNKMKIEKFRIVKRDE